MTPKSPDQIPEYINIASTSLYFAVRAVLVELGYEPYGVAVSLPLDEGECINSIHIYRDRKKFNIYSSSDYHPNGLTITQLSDIIPVFYDQPIQLGDYTAEIKPDGVQVGCTFVPWETVERILKLRPKVELFKDIHNPDDVTEWGASEGYRLLNKDEIGRFTIPLEELEFFTNDKGRWLIGNSGNNKHLTYRTKLSVEELAAKRRER